MTDRQTTDRQMKLRTNTHGCELITTVIVSFTLGINMPCFTNAALLYQINIYCAKDRERESTKCLVISSEDSGARF